jgi:D-alanyl-D-alanine carboxypeptidase
LALAGLVVGTVSTSADARRRHRYDPPSASIVIDVNSGKVLEADNADARRHPASLTKIMTLYLLFEQMEAGKMKLTTEMPVSAHAAAQAPSKLGLKPGDTIDVGTAIGAIVTKSANDVAVIVAEAIGGTELEFAKMMTAKAHALGMDHTNYHNASGLPDDLQVTTARDQAILGRAIQDRFPKYYHYFSTRMFTWHGKHMRNHNHLLGRVDGVDGIKTGYIHDSGFNIVVSVHRGDRRLIVVVFGGSSGRERDARATSLITKTLDDAATKRTAPLVVEGWHTKIARPIPRPPERPDIAQKVASAAPVPRPAPPVPGSTDPIRPVPVKTISVEPGVVHTASLTPLPSAGRKLKPAPAMASPAKITTIATVKSEPPVFDVASTAKTVESTSTAKSEPPAPTKPTNSVKLAAAGTATGIKAAAQELAAKPQGDWQIQVGAFDVETDAKQRLSIARKKAKEQLGDANPYTEPVAKGDKTLYRARFAGLDKPQAETACKHLKRSDIPCFVLRN